MQRYPSHLGSGWSQIVRAIWQALSDGKLGVVEEGLSTLAVAVSAAEAAGCLQSVAPALLGLAVIAATLESHPHLCFAALKCIEAMTVVLLRQRIGTLVRSSHTMYVVSCCYHTLSTQRAFCERVARSHAPQEWTLLTSPTMM